MRMNLQLRKSRSVMMNDAKKRSSGFWRGGIRPLLTTRLLCRHNSGAQTPLRRRLRRRRQLLLWLLRLRSGRRNKRRIVAPESYARA